MNEHDLAQRFSRDIDSIIDRKPPLRTGDTPPEYEETLNLAYDLAEKDFSPEAGARERLRQKLMNHCLDKNAYSEDKEVTIKMKMSKMRPAMVFGAATIIAVLGFNLFFPNTLRAVTNNVGDNIFRVIKEVFVGEHAKYVVSEQVRKPDLTIPDELKGKLYDKEGNVLEQFPENGEIYNQNGEQLMLSTMTYDDGNGGFITKYEALTREEYDERRNSETTTTTNLEEAKPYLAFDFSLPGYMPEGYAFDRIQLFNDESGKPVKNCEYAQVYFSNGDHDKDIYLQLRLMNEETAYEAAIGNVEEIEVNGNKGVMGEGSMDIEIDGVMYMFRASASGIGNDQLIKMAESIPN